MIYLKGRRWITLNSITTAIKQQMSKMNTLNYWLILLTLSLFSEMRRIMLSATAIFGEGIVDKLVYGSYVFVTVVVIDYTWVFLRVFLWLPFRHIYVSDEYTVSLCQNLVKVVFNTPVIWLQLLVFIKIRSSFGEYWHEGYGLFIGEFLIVFLIQALVVIFHVFTHTNMEDRILEP